MTKVAASKERVNEDNSMLGNFACFSKQNVFLFFYVFFFKKAHRNIIKVSNSLDQDQVQH